MVIICNALKKEIDRIKDEGKQNKVPAFIINDTIEDMVNGDAIICDGCERYVDCFPED